MNTNHIAVRARAIFIGFSILSLGSVSLMSIADPQATMDLVHVKLDNNDALSSIRGIYGGVGLTIVGTLTYLLFRNPDLALRFLTLFWGMYALSRLMTMFVDGPLGAFGTQWLIIESIMCCVGGILIWQNREAPKPSVSL